MKTFHVLTSIVVFCFFSNQALFGQKKSGGQGQTYENIEKTIVKVNQILSGSAKFAFKEELIITFFKNGAPFREDKVLLDALDPGNVKYLPDEKAVSVQCLELKGKKGKKNSAYGEGCIGREFFKDKQRMTYSRITFPVATKTDAEKLKKELEILIKYGHEFKIAVLD